MKKYLHRLLAPLAVALAIAAQAFGSPQTGPLDMQYYRIERLGDGSATTDAATVGQTPNRGGWIFANATWTYNSVSGILGVINTPSGNGNIFMPGTRIRLVQSSTTKMFAVVSRTDTTVTVTGGTNYTLTNDPITDNYYSHDLVPALFPVWFDYTPTFGGFSSPPSSVFHRFRVVGRVVTVKVWSGGNGTSNATNFTFTAPLVSANNGLDWVGYSQAVNNGSLLTAPALLKIGANTTTVECYTTWAGGAWTAGSTAKRLPSGWIEYEI